MKEGLALFGDNAYLNSSFLATPYPNVRSGSCDDYNYYFVPKQNNPIVASKSSLNHACPTCAKNKAGRFGYTKKTFVQVKHTISLVSKSSKFSVCCCIVLLIIAHPLNIHSSVPLSAMLPIHYNSIQLQQH